MNEKKPYSMAKAALARGLVENIAEHNDVCYTKQAQRINAFLIINNKKNTNTFLPSI